MGVPHHFALVLILFRYTHLVSSKHVVVHYKYPVKVALDEAEHTLLITPPHLAGIGKSSTLYDYNTRIIAYKDLENSQCFLERMKPTDGDIIYRLRQLKSQSPFSTLRDSVKTMYISDNKLSKYEVWKLAGSRISSFCRGSSASLLQEGRPQYYNSALNNELQEDTEQQSSNYRQRRHTTSYNTRGYSNRYRGQTQSQYFAFQNGENTGRAEAESSSQISRTLVSGAHGMGQAQSQSLQGGCEDCFPGGVSQYGIPGVLYQPQEVPSAITGVGVPGIGRPGVGVPGAQQVPGVGVPGVQQVPGVGVPGAQQVPGVGVPGIQQVPGVPGVQQVPGVPGVQQVPGVPSVQQVSGVPGTRVPGVGVPGAQVPGVGVPGTQVPGVGVPWTQVTGVGVPGSQVPGVGVPGTQVPGVSVPWTQVTGVGVPGAQVPGVGVPGIQVPGVSVPWTQVPGVGVPGAQVPGVGVPGAQVPGVGVPGTQVPGVNVPWTQIPGVGVPGAQVPGVGVPGVQVPGVGVPGVQVPGVGVPWTQVTGVSVPWTQVPGVSVPVTGVGVPGVHTVGTPVTGVPSAGVPGAGVGVPGVGVPIYGVGVPGTGVAVPGIGGVPGVGVGIPSIGGGVPGVGVGVPGVGVPGIGVPGTGVGVPGAGVGVPGIGVPGAGVGVSGVGVGVPGAGVGVPGVGVPGAGVGVPGAGVGVPGLLQQPAYGYIGLGDSQAESSIRKEDNETRAVASAQGKYGEGTAQTQVSGIYSGSGSFSAQAQTSDKDRGAQSQVVGGSEGGTSTAQGQGGGGKSQTQVQLGTATGATTAEAQSGSTYYGTNTQVQAGSQGGMADAQAKGQGSTSSQAQIGFLPYQENGKRNGQRVPFHGGGSASAQTGAYSGQSQSQIQGSFLHGVSYTGAAQAGSGTTSNGKTNTLGRGYEHFGGKLGLVQSGSQNTDTSRASQYNLGNQQVNSPQNPNNGGVSSQSSRQQRQYGLSLTEQPTHVTGHTVYDDEDDEEEEDNEHRNRLLYGSRDNLGVTTNGNNRNTFQQGLHRTNSHSSGSQIGSSSHNNTGNLGLPTQTQHIILGPLNGHGAHIIQESDDGQQYSPGDILQPGQTIHGSPDYTIPIGYRGRISSISGPGKTSAHGGQAQTVVLTPGSGNVTYTGPSTANYQPPVMNIPVSQTRSYNPNTSGHSTQYNGNTHLRSSDHRQNSVRRNGQGVGQTYRNGDYLRNGGQSFNTYNHPSPDSFVTVTKSVTGQLDNGRSNNGTASGGKYTHTYYTKSSTCGYFTFSCNIVFGSNGRTRICKPNPPTNPDGTPCCC